MNLHEIVVGTHIDDGPVLKEDDLVYGRAGQALQLVRDKDLQ